MDLQSVRTFVALVDAQRFQDAADELGITQQAVSKRLARLEAALGVRLLTRGTGPTADGQAFLPHARALLRAEERALASVRRGRRALRVDVVGRRLAPAGLLGDFRRAQPDSALDAVTLFDAAEAVEAVRAGAVDAAIRAVDARGLPDGVVAVRVYDEPVVLITGPRHPLADAGRVTPGELAGHRIWMPGLVDGTEWHAYYRDLAAAFGLTIEVTGPDFGTGPVMETVDASDALATFVGERTRPSWPGEHGLRRVRVCGPTPVYPHALVWRRDNDHPVLVALRECLEGTRGDRPEEETWAPAWALGQGAGSGTRPMPDAASGRAARSGAVRRKAPDASGCRAGAPAGREVRGGPA